MRIRVVQAFGAYKRGGEFDFPDGVARLLVGRGFVEEIKEPEVEEAVAEQRSEKATVQWKPRKRRQQQ